MGVECLEAFLIENHSLGGKKEGIEPRYPVPASGYFYNKNA